MCSLAVVVWYMSTHIRVALEKSLFGWLRNSIPKAVVRVFGDQASESSAAQRLPKRLTVRRKSKSGGPRRKITKRSSSKGHRINNNRREGFRNTAEVYRDLYLREKLLSKTQQERGEESSKAILNMAVSMNEANASAQMAIANLTDRLFYEEAMSHLLEDQNKSLFSNHGNAIASLEKKGKKPPMQPQQHLQPTKRGAANAATIAKQQNKICHVRRTLRTEQKKTIDVTAAAAAAEHHHAHVAEQLKKLKKDVELQKKEAADAAITAQQPLTTEKKKTAEATAAAANADVRLAELTERVASIAQELLLQKEEAASVLSRVQQQQQEAAALQATQNQLLQESAARITALEADIASHASTQAQALQLLNAWATRIEELEADVAGRNHLIMQGGTHGMITLGFAGDILRNLLSVLRYLRDGDIKPANILVNEMTREIKVIDFGLARHCAQGEMRTDAPGTWAYMAPEQFLSRTTGGYDPFAVDLWSCMATIFELLEGNTPFEDHNALKAAAPRELQRCAGAEFSTFVWEFLQQKDPLRRLKPDEVEQKLNDLA
ncbi:hypothetical protein HK102_003429 [Quaeritorhiza haematococci]|nr:hypothetical protein HK102_003429 [Quaeritorhiza haematococci]